MIGSALRSIERKPTLGNLAHQHLVADLQFVEFGRDLALRNQFEEKFQLIFERRGDDGIRPLQKFVHALHSQSRVLSGREFEFARRLHANHPQLGRELYPASDARTKELVSRNHHPCTIKTLSVRLIAERGEV